MFNVNPSSCSQPKPYSSFQEVKTGSRQSEGPLFLSKNIFQVHGCSSSQWEAAEGRRFHGSTSRSVGGGVGTGLARPPFRGAGEAAVPDIKAARALNT